MFGSNACTVTIDLTEAEFGVLQHALGLGETWHPTSQHSYGRFSERSYFVSGVGSVDHPHCMKLVERGLMIRRTGNALTGGDDLFLVTETGKALAQHMQHLHPVKRLTRSQRRYEAYLDHDSGLPFGQWLKRFGAAVQ
jgi:hypothetical protein